MRRWPKAKTERGSVQQKSWEIQLSLVLFYHVHEKTYYKSARNICVMPVSSQGQNINTITPMLEVQAAAVQRYLPPA